MIKISDLTEVALDRVTNQLNTVHWFDIVNSDNETGLFTVTLDPDTVIEHLNRTDFVMLKRSGKSAYIEKANFSTITIL